MSERRPTKEQIQAAAGKTVPDVVAPQLKVLFCGINPSLYTAAVGHHFAHPGNRFWLVLHRAGFTERLLSPFAETELLDAGFGVTNLVARATAAAAELSREELREGRRRLEEKVESLAPKWVAIVGIEAYRIAFGRPRAGAGRQDEKLASAGLWVLPNTSGLNAYYRLDDMVRLFAALRAELD